MPTSSLQGTVSYKQQLYIYILNPMTSQTVPNAIGGQFLICLDGSRKELTTRNAATIVLQPGA